MEAPPPVLSSLSDDLLERIFCHVDLPDRFAVPQVCTRWRAIERRSSKMWPSLCVRVPSLPPEEAPTFCTWAACRPHLRPTQAAIHHRAHSLSGTFQSDECWPSPVWDRFLLPSLYAWGSRLETLTLGCPGMVVVCEEWAARLPRLSALTLATSSIQVGHLAAATALTTLRLTTTFTVGFTQGCSLPPALRRMEVGCRHIYGPLPPCLTTLTTLLLHCPHDWERAGDDALGRLPALRQLAYCPVNRDQHGGLPRGLTALTELTCLCLRGMEMGQGLETQVPERCVTVLGVLRCLPRLRCLDLGDCHLPALPPMTLMLRVLPALQHLMLDGNPRLRLLAGEEADGSAPTLANLSKLRNLKVDAAVAAQSVEVLAALGATHMQALCLTGGGGTCRAPGTQGAAGLLDALGDLPALQLLVLANAAVEALGGMDTAAVAALLRLLARRPGLHVEATQGADVWSADGAVPGLWE